MLIDNNEKKKMFIFVVLYSQNYERRRGQGMRGY